MHSETENQSSILLDSHVPKMCRGCCEREDDTDTNPGPGPGPDSTPDLPTDPPLVGCLEVCSNTPKNEVRPYRVQSLQTGREHDCGEKCGSDSHCIFAHGCSKCIDGECRPTPPPPSKKTPTKYYGCDHKCFIMRFKCRELCTIKTLGFRAFRAFCVNGHLPKTCRRCCKYPSSSNPEPEPQVHSSGQFQIGWDAGKPHDSGVKTVGSACHPGCKRHSASAYSENESLFACGAKIQAINVGLALIKRIAE